MGTSSAVMSTNKLSTPKPAQADIKCSTVWTLAFPQDSVEAKRVSVTDSADTTISGALAKSTRRNTIPVSGAAGVNAGISVEITGGSEAASPPVDAERVAQIRDALKDGSYPLVPTKIVDAMIAAQVSLSLPEGS